MSYEDFGFDSTDIPAAGSVENKPSPPVNNGGYNGGQQQNNSGNYGNNSSSHRSDSGNNDSNRSGGFSSGNRGGYNSGDNASGGGGVGHSGNSVGGGFRKGPSKEVVTDQAYSPISFFVDRTFPQSVKDKLRELILKCASKQYVVRVTGDDKEFIQSLKDVSPSNLEVYLAWRNFNEIDSKHYYNTETSALIAARFFSGWEKVSDPVKAFLQRNIRMLFGDKNSSCTKALFTWSEDGASKTLEVSNATGKASMIIRAATFYSIPVFNIGNPNAEDDFNKIFNLS